MMAKVLREHQILTRGRALIAVTWTGGNPVPDHTASTVLAVDHLPHRKALLRNPAKRQHQEAKAENETKSVLTC